MVEVENSKPLRVIGAQVLFRHGARTPVYEIPDTKGIFEKKNWDWDSPSMLAEPEHTVIPYTKCHINGEPFEDKGLSTEGVMEKRYKFKRIRPGIQTAKGLEGTHNLGKQLRERYVTKLQLLSPGFDFSQIYCRSTDFQRTIASTRSALSGFLSHDEIQNMKGPEDLKIHVAEVEEEILLSNRTACPHIPFMFVTDIVKSSETLSALRTKVTKVLGDDVLSEESPDSDYKTMEYNLLFILDNLVARQHHGEQFCDELLDLLSDLKQNCPMELLLCIQGEQANWPLGFRRCIGPLCHLILETINKQRTKSAPPLLFYCTHDETVIFLLQALNVFDGLWPPYDSAILFELCEDDSENLWVRIVYLDQVLLELSVDKMEELLRTVATDPEEYRKLCE